MLDDFGVFNEVWLCCGSVVRMWENSMTGYLYKSYLKRGTTRTRLKL